MSEIPRHWRMIHQRMRLTGFQRISPNGQVVEVSLSGNSWYPLNGNGHRAQENPFDSEVVYQAQRLEETTPSS